MTAAAYEATGDGLTQGGLTVLTVACLALTIYAVVRMWGPQLARRLSDWWFDRPAWDRRHERRTVLSAGARRDLSRAVREVARRG